MPLVTEDIEGVELLRAGVFRGRGSAPSGDTWTVDDLRQAADSSNLLAGDVNIPVMLQQERMGQAKLGHEADQAALVGDDPDLLSGSGAPALGWAENFRVQGDRLLADLRKVPRKVADLMRAGAYRARSIEFLRDYTDDAGRTHPRVITGFGILGAKQPAVRSLADVFALYETGLEASANRAPGVATVYTTADGAPFTDLAPGGNEPQGDGQDDPRDKESSVDIRSILGLPADATDEQVQAALSGVVQAAATVKETGDKLAALQAEVDQMKAAAQAPAPAPEGVDVDAVARKAAEEAVAAYKAEQEPVVAELKAAAQVATETARSLYEAGRDDAITQAVTAGKIAPADADKWRGWYDAAPDQTREQIDLLPVNPLLAGQYGAEGDGQLTDAETKALQALVGGIPGAEVR